MTLGERITLSRKRAGLSQEQLGEKLGVSRQAVSKWESNQSNPDVAYVAEMCRLFGVSSDWLLLGREERQESAPARCPECQAIVTGLDRFCPNCGTPAEPAGRYPCPCCGYLTFPVPREEAMAYRELIDAYGLTQEEVAERVAKSRSAIANSLRLLQLPEEVLLLISEERLSAGHARCLITIDDREELIALAREIAEKGLSVREAERKADAIKKRKAAPAETDTAHADDADEIARDRVFLDKLERELTGGLGTKVRIKPGKKDRGRIEIDYYSLEELNRISDLLR